MESSSSPNKKIDQLEEKASATTSSDAVLKRFEKNLILSILLFLVFAAIWGSRQLAVGVALGGLLALLNYRWLNVSLKVLLDGVAGGIPPPNSMRSVSKFILRWMVIFLLLAIAYNWGGQQLTLGLTVGLLSFALAAMLETIPQIWTIFRNK